MRLFTSILLVGLCVSCAATNTPYHYYIWSGSYDVDFDISRDLRFCEEAVAMLDDYEAADITVEDCMESHQWKR